MLTAGDIIGIAPGVFHSYTNPFQANIYNCIFTEEAVRDIPPEQNFDPLALIFGRGHVHTHRLHLAGGLHQEVSRLLSVMTREYEQQPPGYMLKLKGMLLALLATVGRRYAEQSERQGDTRYMSISAVYQALEYIDTHYMHPITLPQLSGQAGLSPDYFSRLFKEQVGLGPMQYVKVYRVGRACDLLGAATAPVREIATQVGIEDENYFARIFRQVIGQSPTAWRQSDRGIML